MEGTACAFFYATRRFGHRAVVFSLVEHPHLEWRGRNTYLEAKAEKDASELYIKDLIWMLVNAQYKNFSAPKPSEIELKRNVIDNRSTEQIKEGLLKRLGA